MGLDRVVMLLINSADMSAAKAAGTAWRSPTTPQAGPPTGTAGAQDYHHRRPGVSLSRRAPSLPTVHQRGFDKGPTQSLPRRSSELEEVNYATMCEM